VTAVDLTSAYPGTEAPKTVHPCGSYPTIFDEAQAVGLSWRYYTSNESGLWGGPSAVNQDCMGINPSGKACNDINIVPCSPQALSDLLNIGSKGLADVTYVIPNSSWSDHARAVAPNSKTGPNWVTWLVNAIGKSAYWKTTTIIVTWDDWGGWYDHYQPGGTPGLGLINCATNGPLVTPASCGFRVPVMVIGPYVKSGYIDSTDTNAGGSILLYIEHTFGLPTLTPRGSNALGTADDWTADDLMNTMAFGNAPTAFKPEPTSTPSAYYTGSSCVDPSDEDD
jgi:phospholipase C